MAEIAQKAAAIEGADFVALILDGGDPNGANKSIEELIEVVKEVAGAIDCPLVVEGCKNVEKDAELLSESCRSASGKKCTSSCPQEKKTTKQSVQQQVLLTIRSSVLNLAVDINLAKQLNVADLHSLVLMRRRSL